MTTDIKGMMNNVQGANLLPNEAPALAVDSIYRALSQTDFDMFSMNINEAIVYIGEAIQCDVLGPDEYMKDLSFRSVRKGLPKVPFFLLQKIAEAFAEGSKKYGAFNCEKGFPIGDLLNHALGHILKYLSKLPSDEDDLGHAAWNLFQVYYMMDYSSFVKDHQVRPDHVFGIKDGKGHEGKV
jgi:hypothetical protein